jgi:beta-lactamase class D
MQHFIDAVGYGNRDLTGGIDEFWLTGGLQISPREQVDLLARLYRGDLPFSPATMATVREMMLNESTDRYLLRAKTGWAILPDAVNVGWWVGWVEREAGALFFATVLEATAPDDTFGPARQGVTRRALEDLGVLETGR